MRGRLIPQQLLNNAARERFANAINSRERHRRPHRHAILSRPRAKADVEHAAFDFDLIPRRNQHGLCAGRGFSSASSAFRHAHPQSVVRLTQESGATFCLPCGEQRALQKLSIAFPRICTSRDHVQLDIARHATGCSQ